MDSDSLRSARRTHTNGWMTALSLGLLVAGFLACLYILIGVPAQGQTVGGSTTESGLSAPPAAAPVYRRQQLPVAAVAAPIPVSPISSPMSSRPS
jgi:hypothetical protein